MAGLAFHGNMLVAELAAHRDGLGEPFNGRVALNHSGRHDRDIVGDQARIMAEPADGDFSGSRAMSDRETYRHRRPASAELREQLAVEGSCQVESAHSQDDVGLSIFQSHLGGGML